MTKWGWLVNDIFNLFDPNSSGDKNNYYSITVRWNGVPSDGDVGHANLPASISVKATNMGLLGVCDTGSETLYYSTDCDIQNNVPLTWDDAATIFPTCINGGHFRFRISPLKYSAIRWTLPVQWLPAAQQGHSNNNNLTIEGYIPNFNGDASLLSGTIGVSIDRKCGNGTVGTTMIAQGTTPISASIQPLSIVICSQSPTNVPLSVSVSSGKAPFTYQWSNANASCTSGKCSTITYSTSELITNNPSVLITDLNQCKVTLPVNFTTADPNKSWGAYQIFTNFAKESPVIDENYTTYTDIITDQVGNPYYVSTDGNIWSYQYITTPYIGWKNTAISSLKDATGSITIYEPSVGNKTIYYVNNNKEVWTTNSTSNVWPTAHKYTGPTNATSVKVNGNGTLFYINGSNQIYSQVNNYAYPLVASILPGSKIAVTNKYVYYFTPSSQIAALDYTTSPYSTILFSNPTTVLNAINLSDFVYSKYSDIDVDANGNAYYIGSDNSLYQANAASVNVTKLSSTKQYNGYLGVGLQTGVVYAATKDKNIYQFVSSNGDTPLEISYMNGNIGSPIGLSGWFAQAGAIHFRSPNVFYISEDGTLKVILFNTGSFVHLQICVLLIIPMEHKETVTLLVQQKSYLTQHLIHSPLLQILTIA